MKLQENLFFSVCVNDFSSSFQSMLKTLERGSLVGHLAQQIPALGLDLTPAENQ